MTAETLDRPLAPTTAGGGGTNPMVDGGLLGDVDADSVAARAGGLTPVPGGVGPVTTALLLRHTVRAASGDC